MNNILEMIRKEIENADTRSAWNNGIKGYALEILETVEGFEKEPESIEELDKMMLNGADSWNQSSWGGCYEIYNKDIAKRLCTPSELKKTRNGEWRPNRNEEWLDVQARALNQAARRIRNAYRKATK